MAYAEDAKTYTNGNVVDDEDVQSSAPDAAEARHLSDLLPFEDHSLQAASQLLAPAAAPEA